MTAPTNKRAMRQLSVREKIDAVQRVHEGESKASVARQIGVPESTLRGWCKNEMKLKTMDKSGHGSHSSPSPSPPLEKRPRLDGGSEGEIDDTLWFWLKNQQQQDAQRLANNNNNHHQPSWFWKWYKEFGVAPEQPTVYPQLHDPDQPLPLVVRRNKEIKEAPLPQALPSPVLVDSNKETEAKENNNKAALSSEDEDEPPATAADALKHGMRFMRWLECCSDPTITTVQLLQFRIFLYEQLLKHNLSRYLLNSVKTSAERQAANKTRSTRSRRK